MSLADFLFWCLALFTTGSAVATACSGQIVRSAVWLMFTLLGVAGLYFLLGFEFLGATQVIVYVGGVLVLVVFAVMLTARQGGAAPVSRMQWVVSALAAGGLAGVLLTALLTTEWHEGGAAPLPEARDASAVNRLSLTFAGSTSGEKSGPLPAAPGHRKHIVHYLFAFEIISVYLLVVLIGAAYLARARRIRRRES